MIPILKGTIYITEDVNYIYNLPLQTGMHKIVNLDEDGILGDGRDIIGGTCLLPPIDAKIAEADGNEQMYDTIYSNHLLLPFQQQFIAALIAFLYKGGNLVLFLPELGYTNTKEKLIKFLWTIYGIHPGIIPPNVTNYDGGCFYDVKCTPIWLNLIYSARVISAYEYLIQYPEDAMISNQEVMNLLIEDINPYGNSINDKKNYILRYHKLIHKNPKVVPAIECSFKRW